MRAWKWIGLGAIAAVAVTGAAVVARNRRAFVEADDEVIGQRLRERLDQLRAAS